MFEGLLLWLAIEGTPPVQDFREEVRELEIIRNEEERFRQELRRRRLAATGIGVPMRLPPPPTAPPKR
jgi:hypothetical protein